jgi:hypothetical protein
MLEKIRLFKRYSNHINGEHMKCPHCGETRESGISPITHKVYGLCSTRYSVRVVGILRYKCICRDRYTCFSCHNEWIAEEYQLKDN